MPLGDAAPRDMLGVRVVNLASLWAGPLAAHVLARLGADVVCVESTGRPDGARATPQWFDAMHTGQRSVALDFRRDDGVATLAALLAAADVVIEGSRPRALEQLGISAIELARRGPRVWVSITGYGRDPAKAMRVALGDDAAAAGGLVGWTGGDPVFITDAVADPLTGFVAAHAIADAVANGGRWLVDIALARVASTVAQRDSDPVVRALSDESPGRAVPPSPPFELGAHTAQVLDEWLGQPGDDANLNI
jgi:crotonobetainyl-CoA:carnitine CoA-transferase CaiB-like acyl-CoA transferase